MARVTVFYGTEMHMKRHPETGSTRRPVRNFYAEDAVDWLNGEVKVPAGGTEIPPPTPQQRVSRVLELLRRTHPQRGTGLFGVAADTSDIQELNELLERYPTVLRWSDSTFLGLPVGLMRSALPNLDPWIGRESRVVTALVELATSRMLHKLRACECGRRFFARRQKDANCSEACRKKKYRSKPESLAAERERAKRNYAVRKAGFGTRETSNEGNRWVH